MSRIIRSLPLGLALAAAFACTSNQSGNTASAPRIQVTQVPSAAPANAVWVLTPIGVNVRAAPDLNSAKLTVIAQAARMDITESRKVGTETWLHIKTQSGQVEGWVLDRPDTVIHREIAQHVEQGAYANVFPAEWRLTSGNPATMASPAGVSEQATLLIQTVPAQGGQLPATPTQPGQELRQESGLDVYGKPAVMTVYRLNAGGFEFSVKETCKTLAYLFDYRQAGRDQPDPTLFKTVLSSVFAPDCAPGA